jgi:hypothetical protein
MKKLFFLLIIGLSHNAKALVIQQVTVSPIENSGNINIHTVIANGSYFEYYNYNYEIVNHVITINICFSPYLMQVATVKENDFEIPNINLETSNFTLVVNARNRIWNGTEYSCDNQIQSDTATLQFSTPLNATVTLSSNNFQLNINKLEFSPNPTSGFIEFPSEYRSAVNSIKIFDGTGRLVKASSALVSNSINLTEFVSGLYIIEIMTDTEKIIRKIVLKK